MTNTQEIDLKIKTTLEAATAAKEIKDIKTNLRDLQSLMIQVGDTNDEAFSKLAAAAGEAKDKIADTRAQVSALSGKPIENITGSMNLFKSSLNSLDFEQAATGLKLMGTNLQAMKVNDFSEGIKSLTTSFVNLGKSILDNPMLIAGAAIALAVTGIVSAISALKDEGGLIQGVFESVNTTIDTSKLYFLKLTDSIGLTSHSVKVLSENYVKLIANINDLGEANIEILKSGGFATIAEQFDIVSRNLTVANTKMDLFYAKVVSSKSEAVRKEISTIINQYRDLKTSLENMYDPVKHKQIVENLNQLKVKLETLTGGPGNAEQIINDLDSVIKASVEKNKYIASAANKSAMEDYDRYYTLQEEGIMNIQNLRQREIEQSRNATEKKLVYDVSMQEEWLKDTTDAYDRQLAIMETAGQQESDSYKIMLKNRDELRTKYYEKDGKTLRLRSIILEAQRQKEIEINAKYDLEETNNKIKNLEERRSILKDDLSKNAEAKVSIAMDSFDQEEKLTQLSYAKQIVLATGNVEKQKLLRDELNSKLKELDYARFNYINSLNETENKMFQDNINSMLESATKGKKILAQTREEHLNELIKDESVKADINKLEMENLDKGINKYTIRLGEKLNLIRAGADEERDILFNKHRLEVEEAEKAGKSIKDINEKYSQQVIQISLNEKEARAKAALELIDQIKGYTQAGLSIASDMVDAANNVDEEKRDKDGKLSLELQKKKFNRNKNLQYANAVMNTAASVTTALVEQNYVGAALNAALGAAQIYKISSTQFKAEGSSGGAGSSGAVGVAPPVMSAGAPSPFLGQGYLGQNYPGGIGSGGWTNQRVFVTEQDITDMQNRVRVQQIRSTLSGH
jgi:hypothetical protein